MKIVCSVLLCVSCNSVAQLLMRLGASRKGEALSHEVGSFSTWAAVIGSPSVLVGLGLWVISTLVWLYVLTQANLAFAYGLYGLNYVLVPLLAYFILKEPLSFMQVLGMGLTALGVGLTVAGCVR